MVHHVREFQSRDEIDDAIIPLSAALVTITAPNFAFGEDQSEAVSVAFLSMSCYLCSCTIHSYAKGCYRAIGL